MMDGLVSDEFVSRLPGHIIMSTLCDGVFILGTHGAVTGISSIYSGLKDRIVDRYGDGDESEEDSSLSLMKIIE